MNEELIKRLREKARLALEYGFHNDANEACEIADALEAASLNERRHRKALDEATALLKEFYGKDNHGHLSASTTPLFERTGRWLHGDPPGASLDAALSGEGETP